MRGLKVLQLLCLVFHLPVQHSSDALASNKKLILSSRTREWSRPVPHSSFLKGCRQPSVSALGIPLALVL